METCYHEVRVKLRIDGPDWDGSEGRIQEEKIVTYMVCTEEGCQFCEDDLDRLAANFATELYDIVYGWEIIGGGH
jgi:hypothetical protein